MAEFKLRPEVAKFAGLMEGRLRQKNPLVDAGEWLHWRQAGMYRIMARFRKAVSEFETCVAYDDPTGVTRSAADVANFAMMLDDLAGQE